MDKNTVLLTLSQINDLYNKQSDEPISKHIVENRLLCKLAVIELCGWLEDEFDKLILFHLDNVSKQISNFDQSVYKDYSKNYQEWRSGTTKDVSKVYGMSYSGHFRKLLVLLLGNMNVLILEYRVGLDNLELLSNQLKILQDNRNELAHKSYLNITRQEIFQAPSVTIQAFHNIYPILEKFEKSLGEMMSGAIFSNSSP